MDTRSEHNNGAAQRWRENSDRLAAIIRPLSEPDYQCDTRWLDFRPYLERLAEDYGAVDLCPDFQRGHVWSPFQQQHFLENVLKGVVPNTALFVQFNCSNWNDVKPGHELPAGLQCVDGLQRISAVYAFLDGKVKPFGLCVDDLDYSRYSLRGPQFTFRVAIHAFQRRAELLDYYLALNAGGTPHSDDEIERVRGLLAAATSAEGADGR